MPDDSWSFLQTEKVRRTILEGFYKCRKCAGRFLELSTNVESMPDDSWSFLQTEKVCRTIFGAFYKCRKCAGRFLEVSINVERLEKEVQAGER